MNRGKQTYGVLWRLLIVGAALYWFVQANGPSRPRQTRVERREPPTPTTPIQRPGADQFYQFVPAPRISWEDARAYAERKSHRGVTGRLATIGDEAEQAFLVERFGRQANLWVGGSDAEEEGAWRWVVGPEAGSTICLVTDGFRDDQAYTAWAEGEPNDYEEGEDYLLWNYRGEAGRWNDSGPPHADDEAQGFLVEFSPAKQESAAATD